MPSCPKPAIFSGKAEELIAWIGSFITYAKAVKLSEDDWTSHALAYLPNDVRDYVEFQLKSTVLPPFTVFQELLLIKYHGIDPETLYQRLITDAKQLPTEQLFSYGIRFRRLVTLANSTGPNVSASHAITQFINGLTDREVHHYLTRKRLADRERLRMGLPLKMPHLDDYISAARFSASSDTLMRSPQTGNVVVAALVQPSPVAPSLPVSTPTTAPPDDLAGLVRSLTTLLAQSRSAPVAAGVAARKPMDYTNVTCFNCNSRGHSFRRCPQPTSEACETRRASFMATRVPRRTTPPPSDRPSSVDSSISASSAGK